MGIVKRVANRNIIEMERQIKQGTPLNVLSLEDSVHDFELISEHLINSGYDLTIVRVDNKSDFSNLLSINQYDIVLVDFNLPSFDASEALNIQQLLCPDIPIICISGFIGEELAVELLKKGAADYVLKDRIGRLAFAVQSAIESARTKRECKIAEKALQKKADELQMYYELTMGRELKMVELKKEINDLLKNSGQDLKYFL